MPRPAQRFPRCVAGSSQLASPPAERAYVLDDLAEEFDGAGRARRRTTRARLWLALADRSLVRPPGGYPPPRSSHRSRIQQSTGDPVLTQLRDDLRYSVRVAVRRPWLSLTIIATMVLGVGTTTAVFSVIRRAAASAAVVPRARTARPPDVAGPRRARRPWSSASPTSPTGSANRGRSPR